MLLLLELWAFSGSFDKFFNLDSLFYLIEAPRSWRHVLSCFLAPDNARQYRPLTLAVIGPLVPILGSDPHPYHWIPLLFHLANTILFYCLASRLLRSSLAVSSRPPSSDGMPQFWILQYLSGHLYDVTPYYKGRRRDTRAVRLVSNVDALDVTVSRDEFYPSYEHFATPNGRPLFYATPQKDIVTQIGGSSIAIATRIPCTAFLRFDTSWMFEGGDGGWAEVRLRTAGNDTILHREYMNPNPRGERPRWKEVRIDLAPFACKEGQFFFRCYNDPEKTTVADWLNWRDIVIEIPK